MMSFLKPELPIREEDRAEIQSIFIELMRKGARRRPRPERGERPPTATVLPPPINLKTLRERWGLL